MQTTRRSFLSTLGIAAAGIAFAPSIFGKSLWQIPEDIIAYDGPATLKWLLAASVAELAANLPRDQFRLRQGLTVEPVHQFGVDFEFNPERNQDRCQVRQLYVMPAMAQLAQEIRDRKARYCFPVPLPSAVEYCGRMVHKPSGFDLRFARAWDMGGTYEYEVEDDDGNVIGTTTCVSPPSWSNRFDMLVA